MSKTSEAWPPPIEIDEAAFTETKADWSGIITLLICGAALALAALFGFVYIP